MPAEVAFKLHPEGSEFDNQLVYTPDAHFIKDYSDDPTVVYLITCDEEDESTAIIAVPAEGVFDTDDFEGVTEEDLPDEFDFEIAKLNEEIEVDIRTEAGRRLILIVRHVSRTAITRSLLIPESLIYPDRQVIFD